MNNYKEIVERLMFAVRVGGSPPINSSGVILDKVVVKKAAEAIEQLVRERDAARKERDVAVADIKKCWLCASCRNHIESKEWCFCYHFDPEMDSDGCTTCENYEWRGVQECE